MFGKPVLQDFDSTYLRLDATNSPLTGTLTTQAIVPDVDITRDLGSPTLKFSRMFGGIGVFLKGGSNITFPVNVAHGGLIGGTQNGAGTTQHILNGNNFAAVAAIGVCAANNAAGTATLRSSRGGSVAIGAAYAYLSGTATMEATGYASTAIGYAYGPGTSVLQATNSGSLAFGYANARSATSTAHIISSGNGSFTSGFARGFTGAGLAHINATSAGSFATGYSRTSNGFNAVIESLGNGAFAQGACTGSSVASDITAGAAGAFAVGYVLNGSIQATGVNSVQFGPGINTQADSLQVGGAGIRFKGTLGIPTTPQNGDFWRVGNFVYVRSNNVNIQIAGPGPLTN